MDHVNVNARTNADARCGAAAQRQSVMHKLEDVDRDILALQMRASSYSECIEALQGTEVSVTLCRQRLEDAMRSLETQLMSRGAIVRALIELDMQSEARVDALGQSSTVPQ